MGEIWLSKLSDPDDYWCKGVGYFSLAGYKDKMKKRAYKKWAKKSGFRDYMRKVEGVRFKIDKKVYERMSKMFTELALYGHSFIDVLGRPSINHVRKGVMTA